MAFVGGIVSKKDRERILAAGYEERGDVIVQPVLQDLQKFCTPDQDPEKDEVPLIVWAHCEVTDLLLLDAEKKSS